MRPDHAAVPAVFAGAGGHAGVGQPAGQLGDGGAVVGVAAEQLGDQRGFVLDDLVGGAGVRALADIPVAERGTGEHVDRPGLGAVGLAAPVAFQDLRLLVLGEHALELHQQLILGRVAARALDELHPRAGAGELLDQQRLVGELAGQPVRRSNTAPPRSRPRRPGRAAAPARAGPGSRRSGPRPRTPTPRARQAPTARRARAAPRSASRSSRPSSAGPTTPGRKLPRWSCCGRPS